MFTLIFATDTPAADRTLQRATDLNSDTFMLVSAGDGLLRLYRGANEWVATFDMHEQHVDLVAKAP